MGDLFPSTISSSERDFANEILDDLEVLLDMETEDLRYQFHLAFGFAYGAHYLRSKTTNRRREANELYFNHSLRVACETARWHDRSSYGKSGGNRSYRTREAVLIALFHDIFEETTATFEEVVAHIGEELAHLTTLLTDMPPPEDELWPDVLERKFARIAPHPILQWIKFHDRMDNLNSKQVEPKRRLELAVFQIQVYNSAWKKAGLFENAIRDFEHAALELIKAAPTA